MHGLDIYIEIIYIPSTKIIDGAHYEKVYVLPNQSEVQDVKHTTNSPFF